MKELTIEEKAKIYNEVREKIALRFGSNVAEEIFSEFEMSEDEKVRKALVDALNKNLGNGIEKYGTTLNAALAWLEKQGCPKSTKNIVETWKDMRLEVYQQASGNRHEPNYSDDSTKMFSLNDIDEIIEKMSEQNPADKVEPKFQNGQWIVWQNKCYKVNDNGCGYELIDQNGLSTSLEYGTVDASACLWDITKDVRDGDVLYHKAENGIEYIVMSKGLNEHNNIDSYFRYNSIDGFGIDIPSVLSTKYDSITPATKSQRDTLFAKMREAGYEWDAEKKELKKIHVIDEGKAEMDYCFTKMMNGEKVSSTWSEEDIRNIQDIDSILFYDKDLPEETCMRLRNWLKSLKPHTEMVEALRTEYEKGRADAIAEMKELTDVMDKDNIDDFAYQCAYDLSKDWLYENASWDDVQIACKLGAKWYEAHHKVQWSEEDEKMLEGIVDTVKDARCQSLLSEIEIYDDYIDWLKSLKSQNRWKPSDEQMGVIEAVINNRSFQRRHLDSLYEQLKKLREE